MILSNGECETVFSQNQAYFLTLGLNLENTSFRSQTCPECAIICPQIKAAVNFLGHNQQQALWSLQSRNIAGIYF